MHSAVKNVVVSAYQKLDLPNKVYKYAETRYEEGGQFNPHKAHRNGLSVDFITLVIDIDGRSVYLLKTL